MIMAERLPRSPESIETQAALQPLSQQVWSGITDAESVQRSPQHEAAARERIAAFVLENELSSGQSTTSVFLLKRQIRDHLDDADGYRDGRLIASQE